jgi:hypothetical protein
MGERVQQIRDELLAEAAPKAALPQLREEPY